MFKHPLTWIGAGVTAIGWFWLAAGSSVDTGVLARPVINLHSATMAQMTIVTGLALFIGGVISEAVKGVQDSLRGVSNALARFDQGPKAAPKSLDAIVPSFNRDAEAERLKS